MQLFLVWFIFHMPTLTFDRFLFLRCLAKIEIDLYLYQPICRTPAKTAKCRPFKFSFPLGNMYHRCLVESMIRWPFSSHFLSPPRQHASQMPCGIHNKMVLFYALSATLRLIMFCDSCACCCGMASVISPKV